MPSLPRDEEVLFLGLINLSQSKQSKNDKTKTPKKVTTMLFAKTLRSQAPRHPLHWPTTTLVEHQRWLKATQNRPIEPPWAFFGNLYIRDSSSMQRIMEFLRYVLMSRDVGVVALAKELGMTLNEGEEATRMANEAMNNNLLWDMLDWFTEWRNSKPASILKATKTIQQSATQYVRKPNDYRIEHAKAREKWEAFMDIVREEPHREDNSSKGEEESEEEEGSDNQYSDEEKNTKSEILNASMWGCNVGTLANSQNNSPIKPRMISRKLETAVDSEAETEIAESSPSNSSPSTLTLDVSQSLWFTPSELPEPESERRSQPRAQPTAKPIRKPGRKLKREERSDSESGPEVNVFVETTLPGRARRTRSGKEYNQYAGVNFNTLKNKTITTPISNATVPSLLAVPSLNMTAASSTTQTYDTALLSSSATHTFHTLASSSAIYVCDTAAPSPTTASTSNPIAASSSFRFPLNITAPPSSAPSAPLPESFDLLMRDIQFQ